MALTVLSAWIAFVAWRERRRWLLTWSGIYGAVAVCMTVLTYFKVPNIILSPYPGLILRHLSYAAYCLFSLFELCNTQPLNEPLQPSTHSSKGCILCAHRRLKL